MSTVPARIKKFNSNRIPVYTAMKYKLMTEGPFRFFLGTCHLFYEDLQNATLPPSPETWICGDLHLENFGSYKGDNRLVYFDLNDFDEAIKAPAAWELVRIVTSIFLGLEKPGGKQKGLIAAAKLFLQAYSATLHTGKSRYIEQLTAQGLTRSFLDKVSARKQKELIGKRTILKDDKLTLKADNIKLFPLDKKLKKELTSHLKQLIKNSPALPPAYKVLDVKFRVAGTGSLGIPRYLFLLKKAYSEKYLLIDMKQANPSSLQPYIDIPQPAWASDAERVAAIQQRMQNIPPALLTATIFKNGSYVLKEMQPADDKMQVALIRDSAAETSSFIQELALLTASAQLRSSGRQGAACADELIAFGGSADWQKSILNYARDYAVKVEKDYQAYCEAYKAGYFS